MNYIASFGIRFIGPEIAVLQFLYNLYEENKCLTTGMDCELFSFLDECKVACWKDLQSINILHNPAFENNIYESYENEYRLALNFRVNTNFKIRNELEKLSKLLKNPEFQATFPENESATYTFILSEYNVTKDELYTNTQIIETCTDGYSFEPLSPCEHTYKNPSVRELLSRLIYDVTEIYSADWLIDVLNEDDRNVSYYLGFHVDYENLEELREAVSNHPNFKKKYTSLAKLMKGIDGGAELLTKIVNKNITRLNSILCELKN